MLTEGVKNKARKTNFVEESRTMRQDALQHASRGVCPMIVTLDTDYRSHLLMHPARNGRGELMGLEIVAHFNSPQTRVRIPTELVLPRITSEQHLVLFNEKLELVETWRHFFISRNIAAWINIDENVAHAILNDTALALRISQLPFIELTINENYPELNNGNKNATLRTLTQQYPLVLANFGAGIATTRSIFDGLFSHVVLDRTFVQRTVLSASFEPFMRALVAQLSPYCDSLMIGGIDDEGTLKRTLPLGFSAMQGALWPAVEPEDLASLI